MEEGLEARWRRHQTQAELLWQGLAELGLACHVDPAYRLPTLTTVRIPTGVDGKAIAGRLLTDYNIEIGGGLGKLAGQVWRIGLMGYNSRQDNVEKLLSAPTADIVECRVTIFITPPNIVYGQKKFPPTVLGLLMINKTPSLLPLHAESY